MYECELCVCDSIVVNDETTIGATIYDLFHCDCRHGRPRLIDVARADVQTDAGCLQFHFLNFQLGRSNEACQSRWNRAGGRR